MEVRNTKFNLKVTLEVKTKQKKWNIIYLPHSGYGIYQ